MTASDLDQLAALVAAAFAVPAAALRARERGPRAVFQARQAAMYLAVVVLTRQHQEIGDYFRRDRSVVGHSCREVEMRRDDPKLDRRLDLLERKLLAWRRRRSVVTAGDNEATLAT